MRVGLTLSGDNLSEDGALFASQLGVTDVVIHFNDYAAGPDAGPYLRGEAVGPILRDCRSNSPYSSRSKWCVSVRCDGATIGLSA